VLELFADASLRERLSRAARALVEQRFGHREAACAFEAICGRALAGTKA
jgi:hypothetical protein